MSAKGKIDQLYDLEKIQGQQDKVVEYINDVIEIINSVKPIILRLEGAEKTKDIVQGIQAVNNGTNEMVKTTNMAVTAWGDLIELTKKGLATKGIDDLNKSFQQTIQTQTGLKVRLEEIKKAQKEVSDSYKAGSMSAEDYIQQITALNGEQEVLQQSLKSVGKLVKEQAAEISKAVLTPSVPGQPITPAVQPEAVDNEKEKELQRLTKEYEQAKVVAKNLTDLYKEGSEQSINALKRVEELGAKIAVLQSPPPVEIEVRADTSETVGAMDQLKKEYKDAIKNAEDLAAKFGVQDERAIAAAKSAAQLKQRLDEIKSSVKNTSAEVPYANNIEQLEQEREALNNTGDAVSDYDRQQADAVMSAKEWAAAQQVVTEENKKVAEGFERVKTPLEQYTGTLEENVLQQHAYKQRLAEISAELKSIDKTYSDAEKGTDEYKNKVAALLQEQFELKNASAEVGQTIKAQVKFIQSAEGSMDQLNATLGLSRDLWRQLNDEEKASPFGQELLRNINALDAEIKEKDAQIGNYQRNVGNYANSLSPLFAKLGDQISKLKVEQQGLQNLSAANPIGFKIGGGEERLTQVTAQIRELEQVQQIGFKTAANYTTQVSQMENAFQSMAKSGQQDIEFLEEFRTAMQAIINQGKSSSPFAGAFDVLKKSLDDVRQKLKDPALRGAQLQQLQREEKLLTQLTDNLTKTFSSSRQEMRAFVEASVQMASSFGATHDSVLAFQEAVGEGVDSVEDLRNTIRLQSSDTKYLDGAIAAVNGLAGAYGAAQGAVALFGDDNEELQKTMMKLQALLTIINGLQAIQNALQTESGAIQLVLAAKTGLLNAAKSVEAALFARTAVAAQAEAVAMAENALATEASVVAHAESAVATGAATVALEGEAVAANVATAATTRFRTALLASGIGALILAIGAAVVYLVSKLQFWKNEDEELMKQEELLTDAIIEQNDAIQKNIELVDRRYKSSINAAQRALDISDAENLSDEKKFALKKKLYDLQKQQADEKLAEKIKQAEDEYAESGLKGMEALNAARINHVRQYEVANLRVAALSKEISQLRASEDEDEIANINNQINLLKKQADAEKRTADEIDQVLTDSYESGKQIDLLKTQEATFQAEQRRKIILESTRIEAEMVQTRNGLILNNERSSLEDRLAALRSNLQEQKKVIQAELNDVLNDPSASSADRTIAIKKAGQEEKKAVLENSEAVTQVKEQYFLRELAARKTILEQQVQLEIDINRELAKNDELSFKQRLEAYKKYTQDQKALADADFDYRLKEAGFSQAEIDTLRKTGEYTIANKKITNEELLALQKEHETSILRLGIDAQKELTNLLAAEIDKQNDVRSEQVDFIKRLYDRLNNDASNQYAKEVVDLNTALANKSISYQKYLKERSILDAKFQTESTANDIRSIQESLSFYREAEDQEELAGLRLVAIRKRLAEAKTDADRSALSQQVSLAEKEYQIAKENADKKRALEKNLRVQVLEMDKQTTEQLIQNQQKLTDLKKQLAVQLLDIIQTSINAGFDRQNQVIQDQIDGIEKVSQKEIEAINKSLLSEQEKSERIKLIQDREEQRKMQLEQKQRENDAKKARFDKMVQVAKITGSGFETIMSLSAEAAKAQASAAYLLAMTLNPFGGQLYIPAAAAMQAAVGAIAAQIPLTMALSAANIAAVLATPVPKYAEGTESHPGGWAWVGDGGKKELVELPSGQTFLTDDKPQLVDLPKGTKVHPDANQVLSVAMDHQANRTVSMTEKKTPNDYYQFQQFTQTIAGGFKSLEKTVKNKKEVNITVERPVNTWVKDGDSVYHYLNRAL